ncbi:MAG: insulinase family protein, partial [Alphaproteobacteria bacterium]|nr:insulinase family protein [Alphaproteobacteria bacterium]
TLMSLESTSSRCEQLARQLMIFDRPLPMDEIIEKIDAVDEAALSRIAGQLLSGAPTLTTLGPG